mgnify:CR=1 FL=1
MSPTVALRSGPQARGYLRTIGPPRTNPSVMTHEGKGDAAQAAAGLGRQGKRIAMAWSPRRRQDSSQPAVRRRALRRSRRTTAVWAATPWPIRRRSSPQVIASPHGPGGAIRPCALAAAPPCGCEHSAGRHARPGMGGRQPGPRVSGADQPGPPRRPAAMPRGAGPAAGSVPGVPVCARPAAPACSTRGRAGAGRPAQRWGGAVVGRRVGRRAHAAAPGQPEVLGDRGRRQRHVDDRAPADHFSAGQRGTAVRAAANSMRHADRGHLPRPGAVMRPPCAGWTGTNGPGKIGLERRRWRPLLQRRQPLGERGHLLAPRGVRPAHRCQLCPAPGVLGQQFVARSGRLNHAPHCTIPSAQSELLRVIRMASAARGT